MHVEKKRTYIFETPWQYVSPDSHISQYISKTKSGMQLWFTLFWQILVNIPSVLTANIFGNIQYLLYISANFVITNCTWFSILEENIYVLNCTSGVFGR